MNLNNLESNLQDLFLNWQVMGFVLGLNVLGRVIKSSRIDNKYIPGILALVGGATCHFVVDNLPVWTLFSTMTHIWFGVLIGYSAVGLHQQIASLGIINKIPILKDLFNEKDNPTTPVA